MGCLGRWGEGGGGCKPDPVGLPRGFAVGMAAALAEHRHGHVGRVRAVPADVSQAIALVAPHLGKPLHCRCRARVSKLFGRRRKGMKRIFV